MKLFLLLILSLFSGALCGQLENRSIIGGSAAAEGQYPFSVSLRFNDVHSCGAILFRTNRALTAAHCVAGALSTYTLLAGALDRSIPTCTTCQLRNLDVINRHPNFSNNPTLGYPNDVAVVSFANIDTNANIAYATLAQPSDGTFAGDTCTFIGWGRTTPGGNLPTILQQAEVNAITTADCLEVWGSNRIYPGHICTVSTTVAPCTGDSGSPLICGSRIAGINSWGDSQCSTTNPAVYTRVSYYRTWIEQQ